MEDASQSPGLAVATELGGTDGVGAGGGASGALFFGNFEGALAAAARFFFFTIARSGEDPKTVAAARRL
jgi:hypothetical protein